MFSTFCCPPRVCSVVSDSFETLRAVARQTLLSMRLPRQEHWGGLPFPSSGVFQTQESSPGMWRLRHWQMDSSPLVPPGKPPFSALPVLTTFNIHLLQIYTIDAYPKWKRRLCHKNNLLAFFHFASKAAPEVLKYSKHIYYSKQLLIYYWVSHTSFHKTP